MIVIFISPRGRAIQGDEILSIVGNPMWFTESLTDKESMEDTKKKLLSWLRTIDDSGVLDNTRHGSTRLLDSTRHGSTSMGPDND